MNEQISKQDLIAITPILGSYYDCLNDTMNRYDITNRERQASFLAQILHETGGMVWFTEIWGPTEQQLKYNDMYSLGNTKDGDGYRYRGRGALMYTGRYNYKQISKHLKPDFEKHPEKLSEKPWSILSAGVYWQEHGINEHADKQDHEKVTRIINGGLNGFEDRMKWYDKAYKVLDVVFDTTVDDVDKVDSKYISELKKSAEKDPIVELNYDVPKWGYELQKDKKDNFFKRAGSWLKDTISGSNTIGKIGQKAKDIVLPYLPHGNKINSWTDIIGRQFKSKNNTMDNKKDNSIFGKIKRFLKQPATQGGIAALVAIAGILFGVDVDPGVFTSSAVGVITAVAGLWTAVKAFIDVFKDEDKLRKDR